ncbi:hypothetical protein HK102_002901 [Quaeritorhiza haematococci]|nr:hypothetical protein HK102_002901 [Quaeritorhiza haematococci]
MGSSRKPDSDQDWVPESEAFRYAANPPSETAHDDRSVPDSEATRYAVAPQLQHVPTDFPLSSNNRDFSTKTFASKASRARTTSEDVDLEDREIMQHHLQGHGEPENVGVVPKSVDDAVNALKPLVRPASDSEGRVPPRPRVMHTERSEFRDEWSSLDMGDLTKNEVDEYGGRNAFTRRTGEGFGAESNGTGEFSREKGELAVGESETGTSAATGGKVGEIFTKVVKGNISGAVSDVKEAVASVGQGMGTGTGATGNEGRSNQDDRDIMQHHLRGHGEPENVGVVPKSAEDAVNALKPIVGSTSPTARAPPRVMQMERSEFRDEWSSLDPADLVKDAVDDESAGRNAFAGQTRQTNVENEDEGRGGVGRFFTKVIKGDISGAVHDVKEAVMDELDQGHDEDKRMEGRGREQGYDNNVEGLHASVEGSIGSKPQVKSKL